MRLLWSGPYQQSVSLLFTSFQLCIITPCTAFPHPFTTLDSSPSFIGPQKIVRSTPLRLQLPLVKHPPFPPPPWAVALPTTHTLAFHGLSPSPSLSLHVSLIFISIISSIGPAPLTPKLISVTRPFPRAHGSCYRCLVVSPTCCLFCPNYPHLRHTASHLTPVPASLFSTVNQDPKHSFSCPSANKVTNTWPRRCWFSLQCLPWACF